MVNGYDCEGVCVVVFYEFVDDLMVKFISEFYSVDDDCCVDLEGLLSGCNFDLEVVLNSDGIVDGVVDIDLD